MAEGTEQGEKNGTAAGSAQAFIGTSGTFISIGGGEWQDSGVSGGFVETVNGKGGPNVTIDGDGRRPELRHVGRDAAGNARALRVERGAPGNGEIRVYYTKGKTTPGVTDADEAARLSETRWELAGNKTTSLDADSTDAEYPSAKAVWDVVDSLALGFFEFQDTVYAVADTAGAVSVMAFFGILEKIRVLVTG